MSLAGIIKITRQKAFLTQEAFAKELNVSLASVNRWEVGKSKPNLTAMRAIKRFCEQNRFPYEEIESEWLAYSNGDK